MVPILVNKDVLDPGNDCLKFMIGNRSYVCTNLIYHSHSCISCIQEDKKNNIMNTVLPCQLSNKTFLVKKKKKKNIPSAVCSLYWLPPIPYISSLFWGI